jgi:hypothetical protein
VAVFGVCCADVRCLFDACSIYFREEHLRQVTTPDFKAILDRLPEKLPRSRLEPYRELIRRRGRSFREIVQVLGEKCGVNVVPSTVYDFAKATLSNEGKVVGNSRQPDRSRRRNDSLESSTDEVDRRIAALKSRVTRPEAMPERFRFVSGEPLRLRKFSTAPKD